VVCDSIRRLNDEHVSAVTEELRYARSRTRRQRRLHLEQMALLKRQSNPASRITIRQHLQSIKHGFRNCDRPGLLRKANVLNEEKLIQCEDGKTADSAARSMNIKRHRSYRRAVKCSFYDKVRLNKSAAAPRAFRASTEPTATFTSTDEAAVAMDAPHRSASLRPRVRSNTRGVQRLTKLVCKGQEKEATNVTEIS
jgi:hypothetical protein